MGTVTLFGGNISMPAPLSWSEPGEGMFRGARNEISVKSNEAQQLPKSWQLLWKCLQPSATVEPAEGGTSGH